MPEQEGSKLEFACEHHRLARLEKEAPRFHQLFVCEQCGAVVEVIIGRVVTTDYLRDLLKLIEGNGTPAPPPVPKDA